MTIESSPTLGRRGFLAGSAAAGLVIGTGMASPVRAATAARKATLTTGSVAGFRNSLSVSPFTEAVLAKAALTDGVRTAGSTADVQRLFAAHGSTEMYVRVATLPTATDGDAEHGLTRALQRASLAAQLGVPLNVELGLWNVYGDVSHQPGPDFSAYPWITLPGPWNTLTIDQMCTAMREYGTSIAAEILATGACVNVWDIGNEVDYGVAGVAVQSFTTSTSYWTYAAPDAVDPAIGQMSVYQLFGMGSGQIAWLQAHLWPYVGRILAAVADGILAVDPHARFSTHTSTLGILFPGMLPAFWQSMSAAGFNADQLGVSYYPSSNAALSTLSLFQTTAASLYTTFGKRVFIAETGYPSAAMQGAYSTWNSTVAGYPETPQGQHDFLRDLVAWGASTGVLSGVRPWAPDYCTADWQPMSDFTVSGSLATADAGINAVSDGLIKAQTI